MNQLPEHISLQIKEEAEKYGFRVPYDGSTNYYNEDRVKGYQDGAIPYALKWQNAEEIGKQMADTIENIIDFIAESKNGHCSLQSQVIAIENTLAKKLTEYNNYKQTNNVTE